MTWRRPGGPALLAVHRGAVGGGLAAAAVRQLARVKPPGAAEALLAYLPFANDEAVAKEVEGAPPP